MLDASDDKCKLIADLQLFDFFHDESLTDYFLSFSTSDDDAHHYSVI